MSEHQRLSQEKVARLVNAYTALELNSPSAPKGSLNNRVVRYVRAQMIGAEESGAEVITTQSAEGTEFALALRELALEFKGDKVLTLDDGAAFSDQFVDALSGALKFNSRPPGINRGGFVELFEARSRSQDRGLRSMPDDLKHPEESVNTFMVPLSGLIHAFDLCERLHRAGTKATGNRHKYFASSGSYGLRFENQLDAENARGIFVGLSGIETHMTIDTEVINHKTFFWLKVPSDVAFKTLKEKDALSVTYSDLKESFLTGIKAGDTSLAERERASFVELVEEIGLGSSHVAEQMTRQALATKVSERQ